MEKPKITAWVTKYALTEGIEVVEAELCDDTMICYGGGDGSAKIFATFVHGKDWHRTPEEALNRAEEMRKAKIASLRKSIEKMECMSFEINGPRSGKGESWKKL